MEKFIIKVHLIFFKRDELRAEGKYRRAFPRLDPRNVIFNLSNPSDDTDGQVDLTVALIPGTSKVTTTWHEAFSQDVLLSALVDPTTIGYE